MTAENASLKWLIDEAYGINRNLIYEPSWLDDDRFDVRAKAPAGVRDSEFEPIMQALLKTRFHFASHRERREMEASARLLQRAGLSWSVRSEQQP